MAIYLLDFDTYYEKMSTSCWCLRVGNYCCYDSSSGDHDLTPNSIVTDSVAAETHFVLDQSITTFNLLEISR